MKNFLSSKFDFETYQDFLYTKFPNMPRVQKKETDFAQLYFLGETETPDRYALGFFYQKMEKSVERNRIAFRNIIKPYLKYRYDAALVIFDDGKNWRFSFLCDLPKDGEKTSPKRFSFLLGEGLSCRTANERISALPDDPTFSDLRNAFSVEPLSDDFFNKYKRHYEEIIEFVTGKRMVKVGSKWEEKLTGEPNKQIMNGFAQFADPEKAVRDYVKKLMGRLVFIQFLQKKGWMGCPIGEDWNDGDKDFLQNLFLKNRSNKFIDDVLEPLFDDLNTAREGDRANEFLGENIKIPYLNGGLFEKDECDKIPFPLPFDKMESLLNFFQEYNFTIDENDTNDAVVGIDPEMLGRIFENLLEDNKDKGAYYTPKEIVQYMCRESLIAYLQTDNDNEQTKQRFREFVTTHDIEILNKTEIYEVDKKLCEVKICDPAIGSGAFPMGLLKELFDCRMAIEIIKEKFSPAEIKKQIIQNNIYGVDIEKGAVDIARLRFWLSLILDEDTPKTLPNLDFKIMQGNSLIEEYQNHDLSKIMILKKQNGDTIFEDEVNLLRRELLQLRDKYYSTTNTDEKKQIRDEMRQKVNRQMEVAGLTTFNLGNIDIAQTSEFFLWHTWFCDVFDNGGFDIVIGNPPYGATLSDEMKNLLKSNFEIKTSETAILFIERGLKLCTKNGVLSYIIPKSFSYASNYAKLREHTKYQLVELVDCGKAFDNVLFEANIVRFGNSQMFPFYSNFVMQKGVQTRTQINKTVLNEFGFYLNDVADIEIAIARKMRSCATFLTDDVATNSRGGMFQKNVTDEGDFFVLGGKSIQRYAITNTKGKINKIEVKNDFKSEIKNNSILVQRIVAHITKPYPRIQITAMPVEAMPTYRIVDTINQITVKSEYSNKFICALLNSRLLNWFAYRFIFGKAIRTMQFDNPTTNKIPIPPATPTLQKPIIALVDKILAAKVSDHNADTSELEKQIDKSVYALYALTEEEIAVIEK